MDSDGMILFEEMMLRLERAHANIYDNGFEHEMIYGNNCETCRLINHAKNYLKRIKEKGK